MLHLYSNAGGFHGVYKHRRIDQQRPIQLTQNSSSLLAQTTTVEMESSRDTSNAASGDGVSKHYGFQTRPVIQLTRIMHPASMLILLYCFATERRWTCPAEMTRSRTETTKTPPERQPPRARTPKTPKIHRNKPKSRPKMQLPKTSPKMPHPKTQQTKIKARTKPKSRPKSKGRWAKTKQRCHIGGT